MENYICKSCNSQHNKGESFYFILDSDGTKHTVCSVGCFNDIKKVIIKTTRKTLSPIKPKQYVKELISSLRSQSPVVEVW